MAETRAFSRAASSSSLILRRSRGSREETDWILRRRLSFRANSFAISIEGKKSSDLSENMSHSFARREIATRARRFVSGAARTCTSPTVSANDTGGAPGALGNAIRRARALAARRSAARKIPHHGCLLCNFAGGLHISDSRRVEERRRNRRSLLRVNHNIRRRAWSSHRSCAGQSPPDRRPARPPARRPDRAAIARPPRFQVPHLSPWRGGPAPRSVDAPH